jgi:hypothetical protein
VVNQFLANLQQDSTLKWQYFGDENGVLTMFPANKFTDCGSYDARYRFVFAFNIFSTVLRLYRLTSTTCSDKMCPNYAEKQKKHVPKIGIKDTGCSDVHVVIERPALVYSVELFGFYLGRNFGLNWSKPVIDLKWVQAFQLHVFHTVIRCKEYRMSPN